MELQLRVLRDKRGLSIKQMYQRMQVKDSRYRKWESGSAAIPLEYAVEASDILHCSLDELVGRATPVLSADEQRHHVRDEHLESHRRQREQWARMAATLYCRNCPINLPMMYIPSPSVPSHSQNQ